MVFVCLFAVSLSLIAKQNWSQEKQWQLRPEIPDIPCYKHHIIYNQWISLCKIIRNPIIYFHPGKCCSLSLHTLLAELKPWQITWKHEFCLHWGPWGMCYDIFLSLDISHDCFQKVGFVSLFVFFRCSSSISLFLSATCLPSILSFWTYSFSDVLQCPYLLPLPFPP